MNENTNKKIIGTIIIAVLLIAAVAVGIFVYKNTKLYNGDGKYYSQQDENVYLQFKNDGNFSLVTKTDENTEEMSNGTWKENKDKITLNFNDDGSSYTFIKNKDGYLYREDTVFRGKTSDSKLFNNRFVMEKDGEIVKEIWFLNDGTVEYQGSGTSIILHGTYTRVDDILTVRYDKNPEQPERYLVLDKGVSKDIYHKAKK